ncbi:MAG: YtxH domain-containing protein [Vicinamibacteraceae bacterium]
MTYEEHIETRDNSLRKDFFAGLLVGAGLGLLFAPRPGLELRRSIATFSDDLRRRLSEARQESQEQMAHAVERGREAYDRARDVAQRGRHHAETLAREGAERVSHAAQAVQTGHERVAEEVTSSSTSSTDRRE